MSPAQRLTKALRLIDMAECETRNQELRLALRALSDQVGILIVDIDGGHYPEPNT